VRERLAKHEAPREIEFIDALTMTTTGKNQRRNLRESERIKFARMTDHYRRPPEAA
jgi:acetyl-CoA synthetase